MIYVLCGTDAAGVEQANRLGEAIYEALVALPDHISTAAEDASTASCATTSNASRMADDWFRVIGGERDEGAIIVSQIDEAVDYSPLLSGRVANVVPVDDIDKVTDAVNAYTQTVGIYPEKLKTRAARPAAAVRRAAAHLARLRVPRRDRRCRRTRSSRCAACAKWIVDETCDPAKVFPMWKRLG